MGDLHHGCGADIVFLCSNYLMCSNDWQ